MLPKPPPIPPETKLDVLLDAVLFLVRHSPVPNTGDALVADLHRASARDPARRKFVDQLAKMLRERDEASSDDDA